MPVTSRQQRNAAGTAVRERRGPVSICTWLDPSDYQALDALARSRGSSKSALLRQLVQESLEREIAFP